ncbi:MAG: HAD-IA family hydrolase [Sphingomonadales bacterium]
MKRDQTGPVRLVVFDCDGTLVDSQQMIIAAMEQAFASAELPPPRAVDVRRLVGISLHEAIAALAPRVSPGDQAAICENYKTAFGDLRRNGDQEPLYSGAAEVLERLDAAGFLLGLATGKSRRGVNHTLGQHGLLSHFATIQTGDSGPGKPHPAMLERAMEEAGATPSQTVLVGDTTFDMEMAGHAGATAIGVSWGYHEPGELTDAGAVTVLKHFNELARVLTDLARHEKVL